ncbi:protein kinase domain-containing protein [Nonomuraea sp. bgisy101]|uniref:serine/threonine-protein kinase n=1 Tax=Nonomuraea sp. bgisy101 TaxID=3413784 RepID=UPI003D72BD86
MATGGSEESLGSRYVLVEEIGAGGMGTVWRARSRDSGEIVAVKLLRDGLAGDQDLVLRFVQERNVMRALRHPNVVTVRDFVIEGERLALVMDLVEGGDLRALLQRSGTLPQAAAAELMAQVADALAAAHALDIVHRDVKPGNVLIDAATGQARLTDFGVARIVHGPGLTQTTSVIGTPTYLAPEVADGSAPTHAVDVYAVGLILYELVAGRPPFVGEHPMALLRQHASATPRRLPGMADALWAVVAACVAKNPAERPGAAQVATALRTAAPSLEGLPALPRVARQEPPSATSKPLPVSAASASGAPVPPVAPGSPGGASRPLVSAEETVASARRGPSRRPLTVALAAVAALALSAAAVAFVAPWRAPEAVANAPGASGGSTADSKADVGTEATTPPPPVVTTETKQDKTGRNPPDRSETTKVAEARPPQDHDEKETDTEQVKTTKEQPPETPRPEETTFVDGDPVGGDRPDGSAKPDWKCRPWISAGPGTDVEMSPCIAVKGDTILLKGKLRGPTRVLSDIHVQVYDTVAERVVSRPFICKGRPLPGGGGIVHCGPHAATVAQSGATLDVRQRWRRTGTITWAGGRESPTIIW